MVFRYVFPFKIPWSVEKNLLDDCIKTSGWLRKILEEFFSAFRFSAFFSCFP